MRKVFRGGFSCYACGNSCQTGTQNIKRAIKTLALSSLLLAVSLGNSTAQDRKSIPPQSKDNPLRELISGYYFSPLPMRARQDDDFDNPGYVEWVPKGEKLWGQIDGAQRKSCASCHSQAIDTMTGKAATYPQYYAPAGRVISLEQRINICRNDKMKAAPWPEGSDQLLAMTAYLKTQSRRLPVNVIVDEAAATTVALGRKIYTTRSGQLGMTCAQCHDERYGSFMRGITISQGHPNGFPAWREQSQKFLSLNSRVNDCLTLMHAEPMAAGSPEFVALELYLNWRANGLPMEAPGVRR